MLKFIARHSTIIMPLCCVLGFLIPQLSHAVFPYLPQVLFFLMFFTLLGIDQKKLLKRISSPLVWQFSALQTIGLCIIITGLAYVVGIRDDLLLAIAILGATAPLFGSGALVNAVGFDALLAMAKTIVSTLFMPLTVLIVLWLLGAQGATIDLIAYAERLFIYIVLPMLLAIIIRKLIPMDILGKYYLKIAPFNIILLMMFPLGLIGNFRDLFDQNSVLAINLLALSFVIAMIFYFGAYYSFKRFGQDVGIISALTCTGRNTMLAVIIATPFLGTLFLPLIGAFQLPIFIVPLLGKYMARQYFAQNPKT